MRHVALVTFVAMSAVACSAGNPDPGEPVVGSVALTLARETVTAGTHVLATATLKAPDGSPLTGRPITWSSSSTGVATVSSTGMITTLAAGTTTITAASGGQNATATLTVAAASQVSGNWTCPPTPQAYYVTMALTEEQPGVVTGTGKLYFGTGTPAVLEITINGSANGASLNLTLTNGRDVTFSLAGAVTSNGLEAVLGGFVFSPGQPTTFTK